MYREMTAEEKLEYSAKVIEAIKKDGLEGSLRVVEEYKKILSIDTPENNNEENNPVLVEDDTIIAKTEDIVSQNGETVLVETPMEASIYAREHIPAVQEDLREHGTTNNVEIIKNEQIKARVLEPTKSLIPNPWPKSKVVLPGETTFK